MLQTNQDRKLKSSLFTILFLLAVFVSAVAVWYSPILFKGYPAYTMTSNAIMSRNFYQTGLYSAESNLNVFLSSNLIEEQGHISTKGNKLTSLAYGEVFKITGLPDENRIVLFSIVLHALTLIIFTGIILYLFKFRTAITFSLIYIFLPFNWYQPYHLGTYEFALFFFALFFLFYFWGVRESALAEKVQKLSLGRGVCLIMSGGFLALTMLAKESLLLIVPVLFVFLWLKKQRLQLFYIFLPFIVLFSVFWLSNISHNVYLQLFTTEISEENGSAGFSFYGHVYPDPYTYHFEQEEFINQLKDKIKSGEFVIAEQLGQVKILRNLGIRKISLIERISAGSMLGARHIFRFFSLEDIGGPLIFLLILLGGYKLKQRDKHLYQLFVYWIASAVFLFAFVVLVVRNHLMDFNWAIALLISLGLLTLSEMFIKHFDFKGKKASAVYLIVLSAVLYNLVLVNHVSWSRVYDNSNNLLIGAYAEEVKRIDIADNEVIAVNLNSGSALNLNYLTNKSIVVFAPASIEKLLEKNELSSIFDKFGVKYILGYSGKLTEDIVDKTEVTNVATNSLEPVVPKMSRNKGWLMNLIK